MELILLGTGGPLRSDRNRIGMLVVATGCPLLLIDTCGGFELVQQLAHVGHQLSDIGHVVVTHRHGDHIGGALPLIMSGHPIRFYGHADALAGVRELVAATFPEWVLPDTTRFEPVDAGKDYDFGGLNVEFFSVNHRVPTLAVRVSHRGRTIAYSADSLPCDALVTCARDADLFVCDALGAESEGVERTNRVRALMHPTAREAAELARRASVKNLALVHLGRPADPQALIQEAAVTFQGPISVPQDGTRYALE